MPNLSKTLYTTGYLRDGAAKLLPGRAKIGKVATFDGFVKRLNLLVVDIRLVPWSEAACWRKDGPQGLTARLGQLRSKSPGGHARSRLPWMSQGRYLWVPALGNLNYKNGGPIHLKNSADGVRQVLDACRATGMAPLLLCGCEDVCFCHRSDAARLFEPHFEQWIEADYWCHPAELGKWGTVVGTVQPWTPQETPWLDALSVHVTDDDIRRGNRGAPSGCPLSLAITRALRQIGEKVEHVAVGAASVDVYPGESEVVFNTHRMPDPARAFVKRFDAGLPVEPLEFDLPLEGARLEATHAAL